ncbi:MAG: TlpA family protein disulfide reductase [Kordia sp.]|uniref:TlpA family protein disulfide reductase n=1 Tax=Kordia sp. TaxID=1965332 RepID=UPI00385A960B
MKKLLLFVAAFAIFSCKTDTKKNPAATTETKEIEKTILSGKIENPKEDKIFLSGEGLRKEITLNDAGVFQETVNVQEGFYSIRHGRNRASLFLTPGDSIHITTDAMKFTESITFSGKGTAPNTYLAKKLSEGGNLNFQEVYAKEEADFLKKIEEEKMKALGRLTDAKGLSTEFVALEKESIHYEYLANLSRYPSYHPYFAKKENYKASESLLKPLEKVDYDNEDDFRNFESYQQIVSQHYMQSYYEDSLKMESINTIKNIKSQNIKNALASEMKYDISPSGKHTDKIYNTIKEIAKDEKVLKKATEKYTKVKKLVKGKNSPAFDYENHKGGKTSLADLEGKYVYIDVWATWCGPCIGEIPSLKKVEKKYHNKNIEFVSISIDQKDAYKTWKKMVKNKELGGIQLMADDAWKSKFVTDYAIEGIPRFILIDPKGKIVNADAPRPSNPELIELFNELKI